MRQGGLSPMRQGGLSPMRQGGLSPMRQGGLPPTRREQGASPLPPSRPFRLSYVKTTKCWGDSRPRSAYAETRSSAPLSTQHRNGQDHAPGHQCT
jgi:hypothetical protein